jgi:hypothetical protein
MEAVFRQLIVRITLVRHDAAGNLNNDPDDTLYSRRTLRPVGVRRQVAAFRRTASAVRGEKCEHMHQTREAGRRAGLPKAATSRRTPYCIESEIHIFAPSTAFP